MSDTIEVNSAKALTIGTRAQAFVELIKPRITFLVLIATTFGFCLAQPTPVDVSAVVLLGHTLLGTLLVGGSANALNQLIEARYDAQMARTMQRPIPSGRISNTECLYFGAFAAATGVAYLLVLVNPLAALVAGTSWLSYLLIYTPLKRVSPLSVFVGALPGALPPLIGWAGRSGSLSLEAALLFAIVFVWQLPHFAAIAWLYRDDYRKAGFPVLAVVDTDGLRSNLHMITNSVALIAASLLPTVYGLAGARYAVGAMILGLGFLICGILFSARKTTRTARLHLLVSVTYLPLLFTLLLLDRTPG